MLAREQAEVAAWACLHARPLIKRSSNLYTDALSEYWIASRCRIDRWGLTLRRLGECGASPADENYETLQQLFDEIVIAEILTRAVAAITHLHDLHHNRMEASPIGRNVLTSHRDSRRRLVALLTSWWKTDSEKWRRANKLMRRADRWSDSLLAYTGEAEEVSSFACLPDRVGEFALDARLHEASATNAALLVFSLRSSFTASSKSALNAELNRRISGAALGLFGPQAFDSLGLAIPTWMIRIERSAEEAITMIDRLFGEDFQKKTSESSKRDRWTT